MFKIVDFQGAAILSSVVDPFCRSKQKSGARHEHSPPQTILHFTPNRSIGSRLFPLRNPFSTSFGGQPFVSKDRWPRSTLWNRFSVPLSVEKAPKTASKLHEAQGRSGLQRSKKNHQDFDADRPAASKDTYDFGGRLFDRWCSSSLALFFSAIYLSRRPGNLFYLLSPVKTSQKSPRGVRTMAFKHECSMCSLA